MAIRLKRAYDKPAKSDGYRVMVDRIWPRGVSKDKADLDEWMKNIAPSTKLRKWFGHDRERWQEFKKRYFEELDAHSEDIDSLRKKAEQGRLTLVFGAKDEEHNNAVALKEYLERD